MNAKSKLLNEKGQSLVIVALVMIGLLAVLALVVDGGMTYSHRRTAQAAADSSALASADELCRTQDSTSAYNVAVNYAARNDATLTSFSWDLDNREVDVSVEIQFPTFVAQILGQPRVTVPATASAGCVPVGTGTGVLPVAWTCRPSIGGGEGSPGEFPESCVNPAERLTLDEAADQDRFAFDSRLFIIIDSNDPDFDLENVCYPDGSVICDLDGDGENDVFLGSGARGWLDLTDGSGGAAELSDWILHGFPSQIQIHDWLPNQTGVANRLFRDVETRRADISPLVAVPVFDVFCPFEPLSHCPSLVHPTLDRIMSGGVGANYYHIVGIAAFWITCVDAPSTPDRGDCPGLAEFINQNPTINPSSIRAVEGYYLYGYVPGLGGSDGVDTGAYNILLTR